MAIVDDKDFTDLDGTVALERLLRMWQLEYPDFDPTRPSPDQRIFAQMASVWERTGFYVDVRGAECFVPTAQERQSLLDLGVSVAFQPTTRVAARADVEYTITRSVIPGARVVIPGGSRVSTAATADQIDYETLGDLEFLPDGNTAQVAITTTENSQLKLDLTQASGETFQSFVLTATPYLDDSLLLTDELGAFTQVTTFADSTPTDAHVTLRIDARERATVIFGDGNTGRLPSGQIGALYRFGGGEFGEVEVGQLVVPAVAQIADDDGNSVLVTTTNLLASTPGVDRQSIAELRREIPQAAQSPRRTVSRTDFENNARLLIGGVARALAVTLNEAPTIVPLNESWVYIVPKGGGQATQALLDDVAAIYEDDGERPACNTVVVRVLQAPYVVADVTTRIFVDPNTTRKAAKDAIVGTLVTFFDPENFVETELADGSTVSQATVAFGLQFAEETGQPDGELGWASVLCEIEDTLGVAKVDDTTDRLLFTVNGVESDSDVSLTKVEFPVLGTVTVIDAETGTPIL